MSKQLHKNFTDDQVKSLLKSFLDKEIKINYFLEQKSGTVVFAQIIHYNILFILK